MVVSFSLSDLVGASGRGLQYNEKAVALPARRPCAGETGLAGEKSALTGEISPARFFVLSVKPWSFVLSPLSEILFLAAVKQTVGRIQRGVFACRRFCFLAQAF